MRSPRRRATALALTVLLALAGCTSGVGPPAADDFSSSAAPSPAVESTTAPDPSPTPSPSPSPEPTEREPQRAKPVVEPVPRAQWKRMVEVGMWRPGCPVRRPQLRRVEVNYVSFAGDVRRGALVVNRDVAASVARIFTKLFEAGFPIRRMRPAQAYDGNSNASLRADNTSAYNCRRPTQINAPPMESPHANGRAIDINPRENPWVDLRCDCWFPGPEHRKRTAGKGKILKGGVVWKAFTREGWIWQNIDVPDYMHFDTGYPSEPYHRPQRRRDG